ncbi:MAG: serine hydrolase, partial [Bacteroidia bacterium]|nr:serine hydrolase [Bacteroidia bacterium]
SSLIKPLTILLFFHTSLITYGQSLEHFADSIRQKYDIPELAFAIVSADSIYEMKTLGFQRINTQYIAQSDDKFRIGSNTKAITCFIAAELVKKGKINWDTKFFELFPDLIQSSNKKYLHLTLLNLLTFRTKLFKYTYTNTKPSKDQFNGTEEEQRYQFTKWFFQQKPVCNKDSINFSNLGYVAAGLMLEKASGKQYKQLVAELGQELNIDFGFGQPNYTDTLQPWGHNEELTPELPNDNYKLNWLLPAGNINVSLPDYSKFIQLQLKGFDGKSSIFTKEEFMYLHYGLPEFALGWFWEIDEKNQKYSFNTGNPGTFLSKVFVFNDIAFIILTNSQTDKTDIGINILYEKLKNKYSK